jgi:hypothetical protein
MASVPEVFLSRTTDSDTVAYAKRDIVLRSGYRSFTQMSGVVPGRSFFHSTCRDTNSDIIYHVRDNKAVYQNSGNMNESTFTDVVLHQMA